MLRTLLFSVAFAAFSFTATAQQSTSNALTKRDIENMSWVEAMQDYRVNFHTVVEKFDDAFEGKPYEKGHGWKQFKRWQHFMESRVDADGNRPRPDVLYQAIQKQKQSTTTEYGDWTAIGPFNAPSGGGIGRINHVAFHPDHNDTIYAGAPSGGLWVSYDDGQSWATFTDELTNIGVSDLAIDPSNPDVMYLATGDRDAADTYSFGLLKSVDGGVTWASTGLSFGLTNNYRIGRVVVDPDSTNIVYVATNGGIYRSTDAGANFSLEQSGLFFGVHKATGDTVYATTTGSTPRVFRSTDLGDTWTLLSTGLPTSGKYRCELALSATPGTLYVVYGASDYGFGGLYKSTNGGTSWTLQSSTPNIMGWSNTGTGTGGQAWYDLSIACDPNNENTIYVGGVNIWKSTNGGTSWSCVGHWYGAGSTPYVHADHHHAIFRPGTSELYVGTDGGVYKTSDGGSNWTDLNDGMNITQYYKISQSTSDTSMVVGGAQDNGSHLRSSSNWIEVTGGDGMDNGVDVVNDQIMYTSIYYGSFYKSINGGSFFSSINTLPPAGSGNWVTPFNVDPVSSNTIYAGFSKLWKSSNGGGTWTATSTSNISGTQNIDEFEIAPSNTNYIYALINSTIYLSTNGGSTWSAITPSGSLSPGSNITGVAIDPDDEEHIAISISGYNASKKAMESFDAGATWTNISTGLPNVPATAIIFEAGGSDGIYVGTDIGVYYKSAQYPNYVSYNKNLPNVIISDFELFESQGLLRIGTYGRGVWQSPLMSSLTSTPVANFTADPTATCDLTDTITLFDASSGTPTNWYWNIVPSTYSFVGGTNDSSQNPKLQFTATGTYTITLTASNTYGSDDTTKFQVLSVGGNTLPFIEDFESGLPGWEINNPDGGKTWEVATVAGSNPGSTAMKMDFYSYSSQGAKDELISPVLSFANDTNVVMTFEYASAFYTGYTDSLNVYVSTDCGTNWTKVAGYKTDESSFTTAGALNSAFTPSSSATWCQGTSTVSCPSIDLNAYSGMTGVRIKFESVNGYSNNLYLDNINISGQALVAPVASLSGDTAACTGQTLQFYDLSIPTSNARLWTFQGGTPATSTLANPQVTYATAGTYDVKLVVANAAGSDSLTLTNFVNIITASIAEVSLGVNSTTICKNDSVFATATPTNGGASPSFEWLVNGTVVSSVNSSFSTTLQDGDVLKVRMTSSDDCVSAKVVEDSLVFTVNNLPAVSLGAQGYVCELDEPKLLSGGLPLGGVYSGAGVINDTIYPSLAGTGSHWIYYTYTDPSTGCSKESKRAISVQAAPAKPTVTQSATTGELSAITSPGTYTYQWLDGNLDPISGATSATFMPTANGDYAVEIKSNIQCANSSDLFSVNNIGLEEEVFTDFQIFPNPATSRLNITVQGSADLQILDASGRLVYAGVVSGSQTLDVAEWARGVYMIQVIMGESTTVQTTVLK